MIRRPLLGLEGLHEAPFRAYAVVQNQTILFWNTGAARILGIPKDQAGGRRCYEVIQSSFAGGPAPAGRTDAFRVR